MWGSSKALRDDWDDIAVAGRTIYICFDSDACSKPDVQQAERGLVAALGRRGARAVCALRVPAAADGGKQGIDDYVYPVGRSLT
jgi:hypothetical protein